MTTKRTLTISGMEQKDNQGNAFLKDCVTVNGDFNSVSLWNMVLTVRDRFPKLTDENLDVVGVTNGHAIKHRDWYITMLPTGLYIEQTGSCSVGFSLIPYEYIESMKLDFYLDGSRLVGIWVNLVSGLQLRLF